MAYSIFLLAGLILAPLIAHFRGWSPTALFAIAMLLYAVFAGISIITTQIVLNTMPETVPTFQDTYYVVNRGHVSLNFALIMAFFAALIWLQNRFHAMFYPKTTKALFWLLHLGLLGGSIFLTVFALFIPIPRRYIDYPALIDIIILVNSWATILSYIAAFGLLALCVRSGFSAWLASRN